MDISFDKLFCFEYMKHNFNMYQITLYHIAYLLKQN